MLYTGDSLLTELKKRIEQKLGWGDSTSWVNQDFIALSKKIQEETGSAVSHMTLKRIWGKIKYEGLPQVYTLNTLSRFAGYESWRDFTVQTGAHETQVLTPDKHGRHDGNRSAFKTRLLITAATVGCIMIVLAVIAAGRKRINPEDFQF